VALGAAARESKLQAAQGEAGRPNIAPKPHAARRQRSYGIIATPSNGRNGNTSGDQIPFGNRTGVITARSTPAQAGSGYALEGQLETATRVNS
jgi:hypothetical protein